MEPKNVELERDMNEYKKFINYPLSSQISRKVNGSIIERPFFDLEIAWEGIAGTLQMPFLVPTITATFNHRFAERLTLPMRITNALKERLTTKKHLKGKAKGQ